MTVERPLDPPASIQVAVEVSNTLVSLRTSGLQRLATELITHLDAEPDVDVTLLDGRSGQLRPLSSFDRRRLANHFNRQHQKHSNASALTARIGRRLRLEQAERLPLTRPWLSSPRSTVGTPTWFIDLDGAWHSPLARNILLPTLAGAETGPGDSGVQTAALVPDLLPIEHPEWFPASSIDRFRRWLEAHRDAGSDWLAISNATALSLRNWLGDESTPVSVVRLGVDVGSDQKPKATEHADAGGRSKSEGLSRQPLILMLGTVEPRKGHDLLLDALDLDGDGPAIDVVGSAGWADPSLITRLENHPRVRWHQSLNDQQIGELWLRASLLIQPTRGEGFGLPVAEALARGIPVFASRLEVLVESGQGCAELVDTNAQAWADALHRFSSDPTWPSELQRRTQAFVAHSWADSAADIRSALQARFG